MTNFELEYIEMDGLLYPNIEVDGKAKLDNLGKYGRFCLSYSLCPRQKTKSPARYHKYPKYP
ncbi:hypothetical protein [Desulfotomaculum sp. 1211_IL3151]|uniref:hypothetical protein n=1 Tax=Desulfotomaculum sp. 1211_IL3151 TaxID=3084055 RepID=UPI002FD8D46B